MSRTTAEVEQLLSDYEDVWYGDFSKLGVVADSIRVSSPDLPDGEVQGRDAFETYVREFRAAFPDFHVTVKDVLAGETVVMVEWNATGTHEGGFMRNRPTGRGFDIDGMSKIRIEDSEVKEERLYYDLREMLEQLGLTDE